MKRRKRYLADLLHRRNDTHLLQQAQCIPVAPGLFDLAIGDTVNIDPRNDTVFAGSSNAHDWTQVSTFYTIAGDDLLTFSHLIFNREMEVGKSRTKQCNAFFDSRTPLQAWTGRIMQDIVVSDQFVD